jgi:hypothetical protein
VSERELKQRSDQDIHERTRGDKVAVAIEHLQAFIQQLMLLAAVPLRCTCVGTAGASSDDYPF